MEKTINLPSLVSPLRYDLKFTVDPVLYNYGCTLKITLEALEETEYFLIHSLPEDNFKVLSAKISKFNIISDCFSAGESVELVKNFTFKKNVALFAEEACYVVLPTKAAKGDKLLLEINLIGTISTVGGNGVRAINFEENLANTDKESLRTRNKQVNSMNPSEIIVFNCFPSFCREIFPCFDYLSVKSVFYLEIKVKTAYLLENTHVLFNSKLSQVQKEGDLTVFTYEPTELMSTPELSLVMGAFDYLECIEENKAVRIYTRINKNGLAKGSLRLVRAVAKYWSSLNKEVSKVDVVVLPGDTVSWSASLLIIPEKEVLWFDFTTIQDKIEGQLRLASCLFRGFIAQTVQFESINDVSLFWSLAFWLGYKTVSALRSEWKIEEFVCERLLFETIGRDDELFPQIAFNCEEPKKLEDYFPQEALEKAFLGLNTVFSCFVDGEIETFLRNLSVGDTKAVLLEKLPSKETAQFVRLFFKERGIGDRTFSSVAQLNECSFVGDKPVSLLGYYKITLTKECFEELLENIDSTGEITVSRVMFDQINSKDYQNAFKLLFKLKKVESRALATVIFKLVEKTANYLNALTEEESSQFDKEDLLQKVSKLMQISLSEVKEVLFPFSDKGILDEYNHLVTEVKLKTLFLTQIPSEIKEFVSEHFLKMFPNRVNRNLFPLISKIASTAGISTVKLNLARLTQENLSESSKIKLLEYFLAEEDFSSIVPFLLENVMLMDKIRLPAVDLLDFSLKLKEHPVILLKILSNSAFTQTKLQLIQEKTGLKQLKRLKNRAISLSEIEDFLQNI